MASGIDDFNINVGFGLAGIDFDTAAKEIERRLDLSPGAAEKRLRELCANGEVHSCKASFQVEGATGWTTTPWELVDAREWRGREVDQDRDIMVHVYGVDLKFWFEQQPKLKKTRAAKGVAGRPEEYDWEEVDLFVMNQLKERGDPCDRKNKIPGWRSITDVAKAAIKHLEEGYKRSLGAGNGPDLSTARRHVSPVIEKFREQEAAHN